MMGDEGRGTRSAWPLNKRGAAGARFVPARWGRIYESRRVFVTLVVLFLLGSLAAPVRQSTHSRLYLFVERECFRCFLSCPLERTLVRRVYWRYALSIAGFGFCTRLA